MRCVECTVPMAFLRIGDHEIAHCARCRSMAMQDVALIGLLSRGDGGAERLLAATEVAAIGDGDAVGECPQCAGHHVRVGLLRGVWIGRCGRCLTVTVGQGGLEELRRKASEERRAEMAEVLEELVEETARSSQPVLTALIDAAEGGIRLGRRLLRRLAEHRAAQAPAGRDDDAPPARAGADDRPV